MPQPKEKNLVATSGFGANRGPFVTLSLDGTDLLQMSVAEARHHAMVVLTAAEAAETDGFIADYVKTNFVPQEELPEYASRMVAAILKDFREYRDKARRRGVN